MIDEFITLYAGQELPSCHLQYKDYAEWQSSDSQQIELASQKAYWVREFEEVPEPLNIPADFDRPLVKSDNGNVFDFSIDKETTSALNKLASNNGATMYMVLLSAFNVLLNRLSNQADIVIGTPVAGRHHGDLDSVIGLFVNTLAIRTKLEGSVSFKSLLSAVRDKTLSAFSRQTFQYEELIDLLRLDRKTNRNPLFDVMFAHDSFEGEGLNLPGLELKPYNTGHIISKFDLSLNTSESDGRLYLNFEYSTDLFELSTIKKFAGYLLRIIQAVASDEEIDLSDIQILSAEEISQLQEMGEGPAKDYPRDQTLSDLFEKQVNQSPDNIAISYNNKKVTFQELNKQSNQVAHMLIRKGVRPESVVAFMASRSIEMVVGLIGILKTGAAYLPIDSALPEDRVRHLIDETEAKVLLSNSPESENYTGIVNVAKLDYNTWEGYTVSNPGLSLDSGSTAYIIYTSGSTGTPKGVSVPHRPVLNLVFNQKEQFEINEDDNILWFSNVVFDASVEQLWSALLSGATIVPIDEKVLTDGPRFGRYIADQKITHLDVTPSFLENIHHDFHPDLKRIIVGGEACNPATVRRLAKKYTVCNAYGPTEATITSLTYSTDNSTELSDRIPIGRPVQNSRAYVLGEHLELLPSGAPGELFIGGECLTKGYLNNPVLNSLKFLADPFVEGGMIYRTGDLARWLPCGNIEFMGRVDNQVKVRGFRIELGEIESHLIAHPSVREGVVLAPERGAERVLIAYYTLSEETDSGDIKKFLSRRIPNYMVPTVYMPMDEFPLTSGGKINRNQLPALDISASVNYVPPTTDTEKRMCRIWSEVLKIEEDKISNEANFFELGGHSLKATVLTNKIFKEFGKEVPLKAIFLHQDIQGLANYLDDLELSEFFHIETAEAKENYVLSSAQKRMYFLYRFNPNTVTYNMPQAVRLLGDLNRQRLVEAFRSLTDRHQSLKTLFVLTDDDEAVQKLNHSKQLEVTFDNLSESEIEEAFSRFIRPFDLANDLPLRVNVASLNHKTGEHILMVDMHHIVSDGVSQSILVKDFICLYNEEMLPEPRLQYIDFAEWQQSETQLRIVEKQKAYWLEHFENTPDALQLPVDFPRPIHKSHRGGTVSFGLNDAQTIALQRIAEESGSTMYMVLLSIYNILLSRLSGQDDVVIGTPTAGRLHADLEEVIGMFVNTLPIRNTPASDVSFASFLESVKSNTIKAFENQAFQYEELIDLLQIKRDTSRNPLFDVLFAYNASDSDDEELQIDGLKVEAIEGEHAISKFDLALTGSETSRGIHFNFQYARDIFKEETVRRFVGYFIRVIEAVTENSFIRIGDIDILSNEEFLYQLESLKGHEKAYPIKDTLISLFEKQAKLSPTKIALQFKSEALSYKILDERANQFANVLADNGVAPNDTVGLMVNRSPEMIIGILGIMKAGAAYIPMDISLPEERLTFMLKEAGAEVILTDTPEAYSLSGSKVIDLKDEAFNGHSSDGIVRKTGILAYILYTSGSTGTPKGVMVPHSSVVNYIFSQTDQYGISEEDNILQFTNLTFDPSVEQIWLALINGCKLTLVEKEIIADADSFVEFVLAEGITHLHATPSYLEMLTFPSYGSLRRVVSGGEVCKPALISKFVPNINFYNKYGPTETTISSTIAIVDKVGHSTVPIGKPIANTSIYILDKVMNLLPIGAIGEICISGTGLSAGYVNNDELTASVFVDNPYVKGEKIYRTGDLGKWLPDGSVEYVGRIDEQVKVRGFRVEPGEISHTLNNLEGVKTSVTIALVINGERALVSYYTADSAISTASLKQQLSNTLPPYMIPAFLVHIEEMPLTSNGKVNKKLLPVPDISQQVKYISPATQTEKQLARIWSEVLNIPYDTISKEANFFELGGHSLKATVLANKVRKGLKVNISLQAIFTNQRLIELASFVDEQIVSEFEEIIPAGEKEGYTLSSAQLRMYLLHELDNNSLAYNIPQFVRLEGNLDKNKLQTTFNELVSRHEILRTSFVSTDAGPVQQIQTGLDLPIEWYHASDEELSAITTTFVRPFDLGKVPLIRLGLVEITGIKESYLLMLDIHHIITDGVSQSVLIKEFTQLYNGQLLAPVSLHYKDFAEWQKRDKQQQSLNSQKNYWLGEYAELPDDLTLPADYERPLVKSYDGGIHSFALSSFTTTKLETLVSEQGSTMFVTLLAVFNVLLSKLSNQNDIVVGTPVAGRKHADLDGMIGMFVNTLPLRNIALSGYTFRDFVDIVKDRSLQAFDNQDYQYEDLIDILNIPRNTGKNPLFDIMFTYQNFDISLLEMRGLSIDGFADDHHYSKFDLSLAARTIGEEIQLTFEYYKKLFKPYTIEKFAKYFQNILGQILANPDCTIGEITLTSDQDENRLLNFGNSQSIRQKGETVVSLFDKQVEKTPGAEAITYEGKSLNYTEAKALSEKFALYLSDRYEVGAGDMVGVMMPRNEYLIPCIFGILRLGAAYIPIDPTYPEDRKRTIIEDTGLKVIVSLSETDSFGASLIMLDHKIDQIESQLSEGFVSRVSPSDLAYIIFTSGSTGKPKGVMIEHHSLLTTVEGMQDIYPMQDEGVFLMKTSLSFDVSCSEIFGWYYNGGRVVLLKQGHEGDGSEILDLVARENVTHINFVPSMFTVFLEELRYRPYKGSALKYIFLAGEALGKSLVKAYNKLELGAELVNVYGPTEATIYSTGMKVGHRTETKSVAIGYPLPDNIVYILSSEGHVQPEGIAGQLCIGGSGLARGYINQPELTVEKFIDDPYCQGEKIYLTGDIASWNDDGSINYIGRADQQVKVRGFRIELGEIEYQLETMEAIGSAVVQLLDVESEKHICAYYTSSILLEEGDIKEHLGKSLPAYMIPSFFVQLDRIPLTGSGKVNRRMLPKPSISHIGVVMPPTSATEKALSSIWGDLLGLSSDSVSIDQNFFDLGGHSLKASILNTRINRNLNVHLPLLEVFLNPTIKALSKKIDLLKTSETDLNASVVLLRKDSRSSQNLFLLHDGSGTIEGYVSLVQNVDGFNCYGISDPDLDKWSPINCTVEDMAARYISRIKEIQPGGPYYLGGWSFGGIIGYEVARMLEAQGEVVSHLVMIDSKLPSINEEAHVPYTVASEQALLSQIGIDVTSDDLESYWQNVGRLLEENESIWEVFRNIVPQEFKVLIKNYENMAVEEFVPRLNTVRSLQHALVNYRSRHILQAGILYFEASDSPSVNSEISRLSSDLEIRRVVGNHFSIMDSPCIEVIGTQISRVLGEIDIQQ
ncbi:MAG: amino acid adenylation domain-containing protein [Cyclobacteriaceae bacterium]